MPPLGNAIRIAILLALSPQPGNLGVSSKSVLLGDMLAAHTPAEEHAMWTKNLGIVGVAALMSSMWLNPIASAQWSVINLNPQERSAALAVQSGHQAGWVGAWYGSAGLWNGSSATWMSLNQLWSEANGIDGDQLVGFYQPDVFNGQPYATLWYGSTTSRVNLHPPGFSYGWSKALGVQGGQQVGCAGISSYSQAGVWTGTAASWVSLHPVGASSSVAAGVFNGRQVGFATLNGQDCAGIWTGTAASWTSLHPEGAAASHALGIDSSEQVGYTSTGNAVHACLWRGTAASWVDLHPAAAISSTAFGVHGGLQAGRARVANNEHASLWNGTAESWIDLHQYLPPAFETSEARGIWTDSIATYVVGFGRNSMTGQNEALMWVGSAPIVFVDPTAEMLWGGFDHVFPNRQNADALVCWSPGLMGTGNPRVVKGAACDGVARVLIRASVAGPGTVSFQLQDENGSTDGVGVIGLPSTTPSQTTIDDVPVTSLANGRYMAFVAYTPPLDFARSSADWELTKRFVRVITSYTPQGGIAGAPWAANLELVRPPVALLHGQWSSAATWHWPLLADARFRVHAEDYSQTADRAFSVNVNCDHNVVDSAIRRALDKLNDDGYAGVQADVVGHSMGGILARLYMANRAADYYKYRNLGQGGVHKLITIDTPHLGSGIACLFQRFPTIPALGEFLVDLLSEVGLCVECGSVADLRPSSNEIQNLPATPPVPVHAIVGVGGPPALFVTAALLKPMQTVVTALVIADRVYSAVLGPGLHDLIVGEVSAAGGLTGPHRTDVDFNPTIPTLGVHLSSTSEDFVGQIVSDLLNEKALESGKFALGFRANNSLPLPPIFIPTVCNLRDGDPPYSPATNGGLEVLSPPPGAGVPTGENLLVEVAATGQFNPTTIYLLSTAGSDIDSEAPFNVTLSIPSAANGPIRILVIGVDSLYRVATAEVVVNPVFSASLVGLNVSPNVVRLFTSSPNAQTYVAGRYTDQVNRDLTGPTAGTIYWSIDPTIASVDVNGIVRAVSGGTTTIIAANGGFQGSAEVRVEATSCYANCDGSTVAPVLNVSDFICFQTKCAAGDPYANCDGSTVPPVLNVSDFICFQSKFAAGCP